MPRIASHILFPCLVTSVLFAAQAEAQLGNETVVTSPASSVSVAGDRGKLGPFLQSRAATDPQGRSRVIVRAPNGADAMLLPALIQQVGGVVGPSLPIIEAVAADLPNSALSPLTASPLVRRIALDRVVRATMERSGLAVGAGAIRDDFGYDGSGVGVAVIDSGVTSWHDDLADPAVAGSQRVIAFVDFVNARTASYDDYGHGTHVAGIIAGNGFDSAGARGGIAPGVRIAALKVLDASGRGRISDAIAAFDYVLNNRTSLNTRIVNLSVGAAVYESYTTDFFTIAAKRLVDRGIVVVAAAGNAGKNSAGFTQYGGITAPGNAPWVLTVGASSTLGTVDRTDDAVAAFSSRGPTAVDRRAKPDLVAPGVGVESLSDPTSAMYAARPASLLSGTVQTGYLPYMSMSGTSQATPIVSGTVALMLQANPTLTPNAVKAILQYTAQTYAGYDALTEGAGFLNARGAVELARFFAAPVMTPYPSVTNWGQQLLWGNHRVDGGMLTPNANAWRSDVAWGAGAAPDGQPITWGVQCASADCSAPGPARWGVTCLTGDCGVAIWGNVAARNVVWGWTCGGLDCTTIPGAGTFWASTYTTPQILSGASSEDTVVWGTNSSEDTVVWGTADEGDTVVWGTCDDEDTVVWGTSDGDDVIWDTSCEEPEPTAVF